jgi:signal transduction histidine kinase
MTIKELLQKKIFYYVIFVFASVLVIFNLIIFILSSVQYQQEIKREQASLVSMIAHLSAQEDETVLRAYLEHYVHNHQVEIIMINDQDDIIYQNIDEQTIILYQNIFYDELYVGKVHANYQTSYLSQEYSVGFILVNFLSLILFSIGTILFAKYLKNQNQSILTDISNLMIENKEFSFQELKEVNQLLIDAIHKEKKHQQVYQNYIKTLAHDLKTPLTALSIYIEALSKGKMTLNQSVKKDMTEELRSMEEMIPKMIEMDIEQLAYKHDVSPIVLKQLNQYKDVFSSKSMTLDIDLEPLHIEISDDDLKRVLENIVFNAFYYAPVGKHISVKTVEKKKLLIIEDQGIGMSEEMIKHVFDETFRGNQASKYHLKGSGIGLHIVKETLDRIKAEIAIESVIDQGTKVIIMFNK